MIFIVNLLMIATLGTTIGLSTRFFSPVELQDSFLDGQKFYALGDYNKAIQHYKAILATESNTMINVEEVTVDVAEFILPVQVAATYQLANSYNKLGLDKLRRSEFLRAEKREEEAQERYEDALADLGISMDYFSQLIADQRVEERTRVMAQFQMLETGFQLKEYEQVIQEGEKLLRNFPNSIYEPASYYDIAWSYFELEEYQKAIENFEQVLILAPRGSNSDRALFQITECYDRLEQYDKARIYLDQLIGRYDFSLMSEEELIEMTTLKLKGVVKETSRELVAKAQLKKGDIYAHSNEIEKALQAYAVVREKYAAEPVLVKNSYIRTAELIHQQRGTVAAIAEYKNAIEQVEDQLFQARIQLTVCRLLYEEGEFRKAGDEYQIFLDAYGNVAARIGFDRDKVMFRMAQCYQSEGKRLGREDPAGKEALARSLALFRQLIDEFSSTSLMSDALFGIGFSHQLNGESPAAKPFYQQLVERFPEHPAAPNGLMQLARIEYEAANYSGAEDIYRSFLKQYPDSDLRNNVYMELGLSYKQMGNKKAALSAYESVEQDWFQWAKLQVDAAELYLAEKNSAKAEEVLRQALVRAEDEQVQSQLHYIKARVHFLQADYEAAIRDWSLALGKSPSPTVLQGALLARGSAYYELAKKQDAAGDTTAAGANYQASIGDMKALLERDPAANIKDSAFRTLGAGMIRLQQEEEAASYYQELITSSDDPQERATFQMLLTELYYDQQDFIKAEQFARQLLAMEFEDDDKAGYFRKERAYSIIGNALLRQKEYQKAVEVFGKGFKLYPRSGESGNLIFSKGFAEFSAGDYEATVGTFKAFVKDFPNNRNRFHGEYYLAHAYQILTNFVEAAAAFENLAQRYPDSEYEEEALFLVGENYYNERSFEMAAAAYQKLLEKYPQGSHSATALYALGWAYVELERMEEGMGAMTTLVEKYPQSEYSPKARFTLGDYFYNIRSYDEALSAYTHVIEDYPDSDEAAKAKNLVAELSEIQANFDYSKAMALFEAKKYKEAVVGLKVIIEKYPGTYTELAAYSNLGLAYEIMRSWEEAVENYQKVLEKGGDSLENADVVGFSRMHQEWIVENRL